MNTNSDFYNFDNLGPIPCSLHLDELSSISKNPKLNVKNLSINQENCLQIYKTMGVWIKLANDKAELCSSMEGTSSQKDLFIQSVKIISLIEEISEEPKNMKAYQIFNCLDSDKNSETIQAVAVARQIFRLSGLEGKPSPYLEIKYLATHPHNIRADVNEGEPSRVFGAGSTLINHLAQKCLNENLQGLYLESVLPAVKFYEKMGFENVEFEEEQPSDELLTRSMYLTADKIKQFIQNNYFKVGLNKSD